MPTQLYLISPPSLQPESFGPQLEAALATGHVAVFQLRLKNTSDDAIIQTAKALLPICHRHSVQFILNDNAQLAAKVGADGVHVGEEKDGTYEDARAILGKNKVIGVSCYGSSDRAMDFANQGADYVAFGAFYPTQTKEPKARPTPDIIEWWVRNCTVPCVAIGGIKADNCAPLVAAGADFIAVVTAVWDHPQGPAAGVKALHKAMQP